MRNFPWLPTRREFMRARRRDIRVARKAVNTLRLGCACKGIYGPQWRNFHKAVQGMEKALDEMDRITKPLA